jgi:hypothetical protein
VRSAERFGETDPLAWFFLRLSPRNGFRRPLPDADRSGDVLDPLQTHVAKRERQPVRDRLVNHVGHAYAARLCERLQARRDIDAVAEHIAAIEYNVAQIYTNAIGNAVAVRDVRPVRHQRLLDIDRAANRFLRRGKFGEQTVTGRLDDGPVVARLFRIGDFTAQRLLARQHAPFVAFHQAAEPGHIDQGSQRVCVSFRFP